MASGILGQAAPAANTHTTLYTVPSNTVSTFTINVCNTGSSTLTVRVAVAASDTPTSSEWIEYDASLPSTGVLERTGIVAQAGKKVVVRSSGSNAAVTIYGFEEA
ncbi:hypothetical protein EBT31_08630 [bacterium]|nr:hypothetical protein [bacterium]